ncbi:PREDICTED: F-box protein At3g61340-like [Camelina sativa]|uniref:F-box protein At3g61340-like n=1 Tax=Camelina sativa TaxID=90675 RepID=A0ABM0WP43_CAMSA|nr:PREDICTED: F-box protein At3g61340-like [Camelina sativa]
MEHIPFDLVIEILLKLPAKSIARFSCVSKLWGSTFRTPDFTESFFTISSSSHPKILITCKLDHKTFFFSSPQPQNLSCPTTITANFHSSFPMNCPSDNCCPVRGLVYGNTQWILDATDGPVQLICNPSTGQFLTLPKVKTSFRVEKSCLGYDPIDKQLKVLCMAYPSSHHILTLGTGKSLSWRMIKCDIPHYGAGVGPSDYGHVYDGICINGVLYYLAVLSECFLRFRDIVCFDVRSEKFSYIERAKDMEGKLESTDGELVESVLVNYKGKLAMLQRNYSSKDLYTGIKMWVLEDADKHQWSRHTYILPSPWLYSFAWTKIRIAGMTNRGEIVFSPAYDYDSFFIVLYDPERNTIARVEIQGMEAYKKGEAYVFLDHGEDLNLMASIKDPGL